MPTSPGSRHRRIRSDHATELAEDYVEAIAEIIDQQGVCRGTDLAERFAVSHVTVNRTIGRLERDGYVKAEPYAPVELTAKGRRLASESSARHEIVLRFLVALGVPQASAAIDSEGIEHHCSEDTLRCMRKFIEQKGSVQNNSSPS
ncbi:MAG: manganese-binding transcriptional regulator MntR [Planctomycetaceae bacterium]|nr:manganese-binding transcriptional regulator MntR [Planctomycetaceae bacterium]